ncbi:hypothetical protein Poli38472_005660 [Pythium oligandrum]|uniref:Uncharacterized protein n=1 Tax=Pythium oligandrum TaxID=41045 RepID=A0A8K1CIZ0_PYTOL|nr:hypothetical protein Poli38472_005660 [Pythium oligandrum]|eukprot:TMW63042.1 hypothetical protein Poli38472_005660 [Pythium oligandrum]
MDARVEAFYARVIRRVCERFENDTTTDVHRAGSELNTTQSTHDLARLIEERWRERTTCYTGITWPDHNNDDTTVDASPVDVILPDDTSAVPDPTSVAVVPETTETHVVPSRPRALGDPLQQMPFHGPRTTQSSVFARIMQKKRRIGQLDGSIEDEDDDDGKSDDELDDRTAVAPIQQPNAVLGILDVAPVTALHVSRFSFLCSARELTFRYRGRREGFKGRWKSIILTMVRPLRSDELVAPGHVLWLTYKPASMSDDEEFESKIVKVLHVLPSDTSELVVTCGDDEREVIVALADTRRFYERIIASGYAKMRGL